MTTAWTAEDVLRIDLSLASRAPGVASLAPGDLDPQRCYWDMWPVQSGQGRIATIAGRELWMALSAPRRADPGLRHFEAKIRLLERRAQGWLDLGPVLPDSAVPYEREWAGSAAIAGDQVTLYFTGAGTSTRPGGYQQALFETCSTLDPAGLPCQWSVPRPSLAQAAPFYMTADAHDGEPGRIKALRDPAWFRDPADGAEYLVFTASLAATTSAFNGAVGICRKSDAGWEAMPPLVHANGVNNELERAHVIFHEGRYFLFWVTQQSTFAPHLRHAPTGLYGMVADSLFGAYRPLNGTGLVLCNPASEPFQTYSWFVTADLVVSSFVDLWGLNGAPVPAEPQNQARHFGGVPAPLLRLDIVGDTCRLAEGVFA